MEPDSQPATSTNVRNIALAGLGVLAIISLVTALVVANADFHSGNRTLVSGVFADSWVGGAGLQSL